MDVALIVAIALALTVIIGFNNQSSSVPTPLSINKALGYSCKSDLMKGRAAVVVGSAAVSKFSKNSQVTNASALWYCRQGDVLIWVWFYRTAFDENSSIDAFDNDWTFACITGNCYKEPVQFYVGKGFVAYYGWPNNTVSTTEGSLNSKLSKVFRVFPSSSNLRKQKWTEVLPQITLESFGSPEPVDLTNHSTVTSTTILRNSPSR